MIEKVVSYHEMLTFFVFVFVIDVFALPHLREVTSIGVRIVGLAGLPSRRAWTSVVQATFF